MGGGGGRWLDFGATYGSGKLPIRFAVESDSEEDGTSDSKLEQKISEEEPSARSALLAEATTDKVRNLVEELYRSDKGVGDGGTADAIRHELATCEKVGGKSHIKKGQERLRQIENILKKNPDHPDRGLLEKLRDDLRDALGDNK